MRPALGRRAVPALLVAALCWPAFGGAQPEDTGGLPPGFTDQQPMIQLLNAYARYKMADYAGARRMWEAVADSDGRARAEALFQLGALHEDGLGVAADLDRALALYREAAEAGSSLAAYRLGLLHATGQRLPRDEAKARHWFGMAAAAGDRDAADWLSRLQGGSGGEPELAEAERLLAAGEAARAAAELRRLSEAGSTRARTRLALLYESGRGVARDLDTAARLLERSAQDGDPEAQYALGVMYATGAGRPSDRDRARDWWRRAAGQGHPEAAAALEATGGTDAPDP